MSFPILTPHEIISALQGVGYQGDLTPDDIMKPTPAKMCNFYEWLLTLFSDISRDDLREATREPLINVHHPHIYEYRVMASTFKETVEQFLRCAAIYDFSDRDLSAPTPERTKRILSGITNFILFEIEHADQTLAPLAQGLTDIDLQRDRLIEREAELLRLIDIAKRKKEQEEKAAEELIPQTLAYKATILECKEATGPLDQRRAELSESRKTIAEQHRNAVAELQRLESEINRLSTRIARSPEKVRTAIESLQRTLASELSSIASLESNSRTLEQKIRSIDKYEKEVSLCIKLVDEWSAENARAEEVRNHLNLLSQEYETRLPELQEVEKKTLQAQRRTELLEEQLQRAHSGIHRKREAIQERQRKLIERQEEDAEAQIAHEKEWQQLADLKAHLITENANAAEEYTRNLKKGQAAFDTLRTELVHYAMKHQAALSAVEAKLPEESETGS